MASTNQTTHYDLSQYISTDKPTYLVDYNGDMSKIDTAIYGADSRSLTNESSIGDLTNLTTTAKNNLVSAINEVKGTADKVGNLSNLTTTANTDLVSAINEVDLEADTNTSAIGVLANLTTSVKTNLVGAINEVNSNVGNLTNLTTDSKSNLVGAINEVDSLINNFNLTTFITPTLTITKTADGSSAGVTVTNNTIKIAKNSNGSLFKFYGSAYFSDQAYKGELKYTFSNTGLPAIDTAYTISNAVITFLEDGTTMNQRIRDITYETNGNITMTYTIGSAPREFVFIPNCLYFNSNFGDVPTPE